MFEILMYLFESYIDAGSYPAPDKLSRKLTAAGFEGEDIDEALTWLSALRQSDNYPAVRIPESDFLPSWNFNASAPRLVNLFCSPNSKR
jgi:Smg protein